MRICVQKSTGRLIEMQSRAREGTLLKNALAAGLQAEDLEEREVTEEEYAALIALQPKSEAQLALDLAEKRSAALRALDDLRLEQAAKDPGAPLAVKDYLAHKETR